MSQFRENALVPVPFHNDTLFLVQHEGQPFVPLKPIVENLSLSWGSQHTKIRANEKRWGISIIGIPSTGGNQKMACIPLRKLPAFLCGIEPSKVKPAIRQKLEDYQEKCDEVLWNFWSGQNDQSEQRELMRLMIREELATANIIKKVHAPLTAEEIRRLKSDILAGAGTTETARKNGVGVTTVKRFTVEERASRQLPLFAK